MVEHWGAACDIGRISTPGQWLRCTFSRPLYLPVYLGKKVIAVFDHLFLQPYAADVTPAWAMDYGRVFSALSFAGFFLAAALFLYFSWRRMGWEALALALPITTLAFQLPMHAEARYSFPVVPISLVAAVWLLQRSFKLGRAQAAVCMLVLGVLGGTFFVQTHYWDLDDPIFQQIVGWDR